MALVEVIDRNDPGKPNRPETYGEANRDIIRVLLTPSTMFLLALASTVAMMAYGGWSWYQQIRWGMGVAGITHPTM